jgi:hypothetical protein
MSRTPILILSLIAAFSASGIPLGLFQVGVWVNMFDEFYEETDSVIVSAERVFDGQHRCLGCQFVTDQGTSSKETLSSVNQSPEKPPLAQCRMPKASFINPLTCDHVAVVAQSPIPVFEKTETPPPRLFA